MAIVRSFGNGFELTDYTEELVVIDNNWGTIAELGIFQEESVAEQTVTFEKITKDGALIVDRIRGDRSNFNKDFAREIHTFAVPHFPLGDYISPNDIAGRRAYGNINEAETLAAVRTRKMERIMRNHARTLEFARAQTLVAGTAYAPSGTITQDWYTEFSKTRVVNNFQFSSATFDVLGTVEKTIAAVQDSGGMISLSGIVVLCSPTFFAALISHPTVKLAYQYFSSTQDPLRTRLANVDSNLSALAMHRQFAYSGVQFIEMRDQFNGISLIPTNTAVAVPTGTDYFKTYFAPAARFFTVNTLGERAYMFETPSTDGTQIVIDTESNHLSAALRPELIVNLTMS